MKLFIFIFAKDGSRFGDTAVAPPKKTTTKCRFCIKIPAHSFDSFVCRVALGIIMFGGLTGSLTKHRGSF